MILIRNLRIFNNYLKLRISKRSKYSYAFTKSNESLSPLTIGQLIEKRAEDSSDKEAVISQHQNISKTYKQLNEDVSIDCFRINP